MSIPKINKNEEFATYFLTFTVIEWIDLFTSEKYFELLLESLDYCRSEKGLLIYGYVFMTNHIHIICQSGGSEALSKIVQSFKRYTTKKLKEALSEESRKYISGLIKTSKYKTNGLEFQIWQDGNYPVMIESEKFFHQKMEYVHSNPVRKGYVEKPEDWKYSSARNYILMDNSIMKIDILNY